MKSYDRAKQCWARGLSLVAAISMVGVPDASAGPPSLPEGTAVLVPPPQPASRRALFLRRVSADYRHYYSLENAASLAMSFGIGAALANSPADEKLQDLIQRHARNETTDAMADVVNHFGEWGPVLGASVGLAIIGSDAVAGAYLGRMGEWGERTARAIVLGAPPMILMQRVTGASRPKDGRGSNWRFWKDANGVSGHAFIGAIPFLTAAHMVDSRTLRFLLYAASGLTAWARVNDNKHYVSQAALGWTMALRAVRSVNASERERSIRIDLLPVGDGAGLFISGHF